MQQGVKLQIKKLHEVEANKDKLLWYESGAQVYCMLYSILCLTVGLHEENKGETVRS
jgi:hypothetical protein